MKSSTKAMWAKQNQHEGDRLRLFAAIDEARDIDRAFYPGSFVDISPSFLFESVTYLDMDKRTPGFFGDREGLCEIVAQNNGPKSPEINFIYGSYTDSLDLQTEYFDLLISLYAGFISEHCTQFLKIGGTLLVNPSHGDAAMASIDGRYELSGVVESTSGKYKVRSDDLGGYLQPKKPQDVTVETLHQSGRGIGYTKSPFAYLFTRVS